MNEDKFLIFLSHSQHDFPLVYRVWQILDRLKVASYMHELYPDYRCDIPTAIRDVLRECSMCISFLTAEGINSQWVQQELGIAYAFQRLIVPVVESGLQYKGFVQMRQQIPYSLYDPEEMIYRIIYAVRTTILNGDPTPISLTCVNHHEHDYLLASIRDLNKAMKIGYHYRYFCLTCKAEIRIDPRTLEII